MKFLHIILLLSILGACSSDYYSIEDFKNVKKIDTHMHLNAEHLALAQQAEEHNFKLLTVNVDVNSYATLDDQERFAIHQIKAFPDRIDYLTAFTLARWDSGDWADQTISRLKKSFDNGALGIKLWKNIGMTYKDSAGRFIMVDNPKFDPVIQFIISQDKTVMAHLGEPKNCWLPLDQMTVNNDRNYFKNHPDIHTVSHRNIQLTTTRSMRGTASWKNIRICVLSVLTWEVWNGMWTNLRNALINFPIWLSTWLHAFHIYSIKQN